MSVRFNNGRENVEQLLTRSVSDGELLASAIDQMPIEHVDAFSRLRVSSPGYRFDSQLTYRIDPDLWDVKVTGDGTNTFDATNRLVTVSAGTTAGENTAILQSHYHAPYTPGRGQLVFITFVMPGTITGNGQVGCGYYDGTDGVALIRKTTGLTLKLESTTDESDETISQANWNIDPMDGTGPSGIVLDVTMTQILVIQMQALYVGRVVCGFDIEGKLVPVHAFEHANISALPYISQASLPIRYWASSNSDAAAATIKAICSSVISDGGADLDKMTGREFVATGSIANTAAAAVAVIRCKAQLAGINQDAIVIPTEVNVSVLDAPCWIEVRRNATVSAGTFEDINAASTVEVSFAGNAGTDPVVTAGSGTLIDRFYMPAAANVRTSSAAGLTGKVILAYSHLLAVGDSLSIIYNGGTASTDVFASVKWREIR